MIRRLLAFLPEAWADIDAERPPDARFGRFEAGALVIAAVGLSVMYFLGQELYYLRWYGRDLYRAGHTYAELAGLAHWVFFCVVGYVIVPAIWLKMHGRSIREYGYLGWGGTGRHIGVYAALFLPIFVVVIVVSFFPAFQQIYPMYPRAGRSMADFVLWQLLYGLQFASLEFFFRAFMLETQRRVMGHAAIFVMVIPYCMLHFQKTLEESLGSIIAGVVLGTLAMRWRSIWGGVLIHWLVAIWMDIASMLQKGNFPPSRLLP